MPRLHVDLQEGFDDDAVICRVDGRIVYDNGHVTTRNQIGHAESFSVDVSTRTVDVEIVLPRRDIGLRLVADPASEPYLGVSLARDGRELEHRMSGEPFGYL